MLCFTIITIEIITLHFCLKLFKPKLLVIFKEAFYSFVRSLPFYPINNSEVKHDKKKKPLTTKESFKLFFKNNLISLINWKDNQRDGFNNFIYYLYETDLFTIFLYTRKNDQTFIANHEIVWFNPIYYTFCVNYREDCINFWKKPEREFYWTIFFRPKSLFNENFYKIWINVNFKIKLFFEGKQHNFLEDWLFVYYSIFYKKIKKIIIPLVVCFIFFIYLCNYFYINLLHQLSIWLISGFLFFWLISGFNFFLKRYKYGKFTSIITRFWKRTNIYFWLVEGFLFSLFIYYFINSSQEPLYMYDFNSLNQTYLINLFGYYNSNFILILFILLTTVLLLFTSNFIITQNLIFILVLTVLFFYIFLLESYQFYYILTIFYEVTWEFYHEINSWVLETESPIMRTKNQYTILALIAKYWHFLFIFVAWVFFVVKLFEQKRNYYNLFGYNIQNVIILFWLNLLFISQWFKWINRRFLDSIYYWFFTDINMQWVFLIINEIY